MDKKTKIILITSLVIILLMGCGLAYQRIQYSHLLDRANKADMEVVTKTAEALGWQTKYEEVNSATKAIEKAKFEITKKAAEDAKKFADELNKKNSQLAQVLGENKKLNDYIKTMITIGGEATSDGTIITPCGSEDVTAELDCAFNLAEMVNGKRIAKMYARTRLFRKSDKEIIGSFTGNEQTVEIVVNENKSSLDPEIKDRKWLFSLGSYINGKGLSAKITADRVLAQVSTARGPAKILSRLDKNLKLIATGTGSYTLVKFRDDEPKWNVEAGLKLTF